MWWRLPPAWDAREWDAPTLAIELAKLKECEAVSVARYDHHAGRRRNPIPGTERHFRVTKRTEYDAKEVTT
jgi:hypothetical protein